MFIEICRLIEQRTGWTLGGRLTYGHQTAATPERTNIIQEYGGDVVGECPDRANVSIQIISRAKTYNAARDDAFALFNALHGENNWNMPNHDGPSAGDYLAMTIDAVALPGYIGQDDNDLFMFSTNYVFRAEQASCGG